MEMLENTTTSSKNGAGLGNASIRNQLLKLQL